MMSDTVEFTGPAEVRLTVEFPFEELHPVLREACAPAGDGATTLAGFHAGRLPFRTIDQKAGGVVLPSVVEAALLDLIAATARQAGVHPLGRAGVEIVECGTDRPLRFTATVDVKPTITLPDLSAISVEAASVTVHDEEVEAFLDALRERRPTWHDVERSAAEGDLLTLDLRGSVNDTPVPGVSATAVAYELGSGRPLAALDPAVVGYGQLPAELDKVLTGCAAGHTATVSSKLVGGEFKGEDAEITVTLTEVKEGRPPELDDAFAVQTGEFTTLEELQHAARESVRRGKTTQRLQTVRDQALTRVSSEASLPVPERLVDDETEHRRQWMAGELTRLGTSLGRYLEEQGQTEQEIQKLLREATVQRVRSQIVLDALADQEGIEVTDREVESAVIRRAEQLGLPARAHFAQLAHEGSLDGVRTDVRRGKSLALLLQRITVTDSDGNLVPFDELYVSDVDPRAGIESAPVVHDTAQ